MTAAALLADAVGFNFDWTEPENNPYGGDDNVYHVEDEATAKVRELFAGEILVLD